MVQSEEADAMNWLEGENLTQDIERVCPDNVRDGLYGRN